MDIDIIDKNVHDLMVFKEKYEPLLRQLFEGSAAALPGEESQVSENDSAETDGNKD